MTQEEKAQRYDEAVERAREYWETDNDNTLDIKAKGTMEYLFPELKESEDERIRKELITFIKKRDRSGCDYDYDQWLAWLEKQGEQKPFDYENANIQQKDFAPKVESKFNVGNWYQCTKDFFGKGVTFDKNTAYYCAKEGCLQCEYGCHIAIVKDLYDNFKLWDISDAKDGDVLYHKAENGIEYIVMSKGLNENNNIDSYFRYNSINGFGIDIPSVLSAKCDSITPATKEQRDLLFSKMKDAGYEWDSEKKELKLLITNGGDFESENCEEKPTWSEEDEEMLSEIITDIKFAQSKYPDSQMNQIIIEEEVNWLKSLKQRLSWMMGVKNC